MHTARDGWHTLGLATLGILIVVVSVFGTIVAYGLYLIFHYGLYGL
jgi:hypothetical protein